MPKGKIDGPVRHTSVIFAEETYRRIRTTAFNREVTIGELIRQAVTAFLEPDRRTALLQDLERLRSLPPGAEVDFVERVDDRPQVRKIKVSELIEIRQRELAEE